MANNPYRRRTEPDMRVEMNRTLDGFFPEVAKGQPALLRKMRRDDSGALVKCVCVDPVTREPDKDHFCPYCQGEGFYWDEVYIEVYRVQQSVIPLAEQTIAPGLLNIPLMVFYTRSSVSITEDDKMVELVLDSEGLPEEPRTRRRLFRIGTSVDYRADNGRLEYWKVTCYEEKRKFLNGPRG